MQMRFMLTFDELEGGRDEGRQRRQSPGGVGAAA
jgi:hypothetical protein